MLGVVQFHVAIRDGTVGAVTALVGRTLTRAGINGKSRASRGARNSGTAGPEHKRTSKEESQDPQAALQGKDS